MNIFKGTWRVEGLYSHVEGQRWELVESFDDNSMLWEFTDEDQLFFKSGETAFTGLLKEHSENGTDITQYGYYPSDRQLFIDSSYYEPDGFCSVYINDRYRVEHIRRKEYWLYNLEDVKNEPEDYLYRLKIKFIM